jgi:preprotein translocase subunit SecB
MEENTKTADFRLNGYRVIKSNIELKGNELYDTEFSVNIKPSGIKHNEFFHLKLEVSVKDKKEIYSVFLLMVGDFEFNANIDIEDIPDYFLTNAPAILFPYVRAYISSLTSISGITTVIIPTLNLTFLKEELSKNITEEK